jgi:hypothetical protein
MKPFDFTFFRQAMAAGSIEWRKHTLLKVAGQCRVPVAWIEIVKKLSFLFVGVLAFSPLAFAQNNNPRPNPSSPEPLQEKDNNKETKNGFWEAKLAGGNYLVALGRISSVSRHKYVLDGTVIVDEVTIDTEGQALARFYFLSPIEVGGTGAAAADAVERTAALLDGAVRREGVDVQDMVVKKYPLTTHSKTIEYRLPSEQQLGALYGSAKTAWVTGKGRVFTGR